MRPKPQGPWWAIAGIAAAVTAVAMVSSQRDYSRDGDAGSFVGPGSYTYGPAGGDAVLPAEFLPPEKHPSQAELEEAWEETDKLNQEHIDQKPEPAVEDQAGSGAKNGGKTRYEAHAEFATLRIESVDTEATASKSSVGGLLYAAVDGELLIHTGMEAGPADIEIRALEHAPKQVEPGWEDVSEASFRAGFYARAAVRGNEPYSESDPNNWVQRLDAHGPGWYRVRVHATGRDNATGEWVEQPVEKYLVMTWPAPRADSMLHRATSDWARDAIKHDGTGGR